jgi:thioredoxin-related protein
MKKLWLVFGLFLAGCQSAYIVKPDQLPKIADPSSLSLEMPNQTVYKVADIYQQHRGMVAIFWQSSCPCVKRYQKRVNNLFERYGAEGLAFVHVSSNQNESFADVQREYKKREVPLVLMRDNQGALAKALGVKGTPTAVVIDSTGKVQFMGWIDNERDVLEPGRVAYLENAIKQFLAGEVVETPTSPMFGCPIR